MNKNFSTKNIDLVKNPDLFKVFFMIPDSWKEISKITPNRVERFLGYKNGKAIFEFLIFSSKKSNKNIFESSYKSLNNKKAIVSINKKILYSYHPAPIEFCSAFNESPASGANTPFDGRAYAYSASGSNWATVRGDAGDGASATAEMDDAYLSSYSTTPNWDLISRSMIGFDTNFGAEATITAATLTLKGYSHLDNFGQLCGIVSATPTSTDNMVAGDFALAKYGSDRWSTDIDLGAWNDSGGSNNFVLNATGISGINVTSTTFIGVRLSGDIDNSEPTWAESTDAHATWYSADSVNPPVLSGTYTLPATGYKNLLLLGVG